MSHLSTNDVEDEDFCEVLVEPSVPAPVIETKESPLPPEGPNSSGSDYNSVSDAFPEKDSSTQESVQNDSHNDADDVNKLEETQ